MTNECDWEQLRKTLAGNELGQLGAYLETEEAFLKILFQYIC